MHSLDVYELLNSSIWLEIQGHVEVSHRTGLFHHLTRISNSPKHRRSVGADKGGKRC